MAVPQVVGDTIGLVILRQQTGLALASTLGVLGRVIAASAVMMAVVAGGLWLLSPLAPWSLLVLVLVGAVTYGGLRIGEIRALYGELRQVKRPAAPPAAPAPLSGEA